MISLEDLKSRIICARDLLPDTASIEELTNTLKLEEAKEKLDPILREEINDLDVSQQVKIMKLDWKRLSRCRTAGEVMAEFSQDAAALKVAEMFAGRDSGDRQRAMETVLNYALGRPVERRMSIEMKVAGSSDKELENEIQRLLDKFRFEGGKGASSSLLIEPGTEEGFEQTQELQAQSWVSGEVREEPGTD